MGRSLLWHQSIVNLGDGTIEHLPGFFSPTQYAGLVLLQIGLFLPGVSLAEWYGGWSYPIKAIALVFTRRHSLSSFAEQLSHH